MESRSNPASMPVLSSTTTRHVSLPLPKPIFPVSRRVACHPGVRFTQSPTTHRPPHPRGRGLDETRGGGAMQWQESTVVATSQDPSNGHGFLDKSLLHLGGIGPLAQHVWVTLDWAVLRGWLAGLELGRRGHGHGRGPGNHHQLNGSPVRAVLCFGGPLRVNKSSLDRIPSPAMAV